MAAASRPFPFLAQRYTQARPETVQPPDDRTYSAEVTGFRRNLPHHRSARAEFPYTRLIMIPSVPRFVKHYFRIIYKVLIQISVNMQILLPPVIYSLLRISPENKASDLQSYGDHLFCLVQKNDAYQETLLLYILLFL